MIELEPYLKYERSLYLALNEGNISSIPLFFKNWVMYESDRARVEQIVRGYIPRLKARHLGVKDVLWEQCAGGVVCEVTRKCLLTVIRTINDVNEQINTSAVALNIAARGQDCDYTEKFLRLPLTADSMGEAVVACAEGGDIGVLRKLKSKIYDRGLTLSDSFYQKAIEKFIASKVVYKSEKSKFLEELLAFPISASIKGEALSGAIKEEKRWALGSLLQALKTHDLPLILPYYEKAIDLTIETYDRASFRILLLSPLPQSIFSSAILCVAMVGKELLFEVMIEVMQSFRYDMEASYILAAIDLTIEADDLASFQKILLFPIMDPALLGSLLRAAEKAKNPHFLGTLKLEFARKFVMRVECQDNTSDPTALKKFFELSLLIKAAGRILHSVVTKGNCEMLNSMKEVIVESNYSLDPLIYRSVVDRAFETGNEAMIIGMRDFPIAEYSKLYCFKEATKKAVSEGRFTLLYQYFSLWKIPSLNEPEIYRHADVLKKAEKEKPLAERKEIIARLKCAAMGSSVLCNPFLDITRLNLWISQIDLSDEYELLFNIALENQTNEVLISILNNWKMSKETRERIKSKVEQFKGPLIIYKEICLSFLTKKRYRTW